MYCNYALAHKVCNVHNYNTTLKANYPLSLVIEVTVQEKNTPKVFCGTAFFIKPFVIATCYHVVDMCIDRYNHRYIWNSENYVVKFSIGNHNFPFKRLLLADKVHDFVLLQVGYDREMTSISFQVNSSALVNNTEVMTIGYPVSFYTEERLKKANISNQTITDYFRLQPHVFNIVAPLSSKKRSTGHIVTYPNSSQSIKHDCFTLPGSSGSAVCDRRSNLLLAMHCASISPGKYPGLHENAYRERCR